MQYSGYSFSVKADGDGATVGIRNSGEADERFFRTSAAVLDELSAVIDEFDLRRWDNYHKTNKRVMDGSSFSFSARYDDGKSISASGYMMTPKNYSEAVNGFSRVIGKLSLNHLPDYVSLCAQCSALTEGVPHVTANLANVSALIYGALGEINWAGFYLLENGTLVLGPFQGKPACIELSVSENAGVCGQAAFRDDTIVVYDVHEFKGHIACDADSASEIVVPLHKDGKVVGVLDIDSPIKGRFSDGDREGLQKLAAVIEAIL